MITREHQAGLTGERYCSSYKSGLDGREPWVRVGCWRDQEAKTSYGRDLWSLEAS